MTVMVARPGLEHQIENICADSLLSMGYRLVRVRYVVQSRPIKKARRQKGVSDAEPFGQLQLMVERVDDEILSVEDCAQIHRHLSYVIDAQDPISHAYQLEISSAGMQRPLTKNSDFKDYIGFSIDLTLLQMHEGRRRFKGVIEEADAENLVLVQEDDMMFSIPYALISEAKLQLTEAVLAGAAKNIHKNTPKD